MECQYCPRKHEIEARKIVPGEERGVDGNSWAFLYAGHEAGFGFDGVLQNAHERN
jgi:hypothetical protein